MNTNSHAKDGRNEGTKDHRARPAVRRKEEQQEEEEEEERGRRNEEEGRGGKRRRRRVSFVGFCFAGTHQLFIN